MGHGRRAKLASSALEYGPKYQQRGSTEILIGVLCPKDPPETKGATGKVEPIKRRRCDWGLTENIIPCGSYTTGVHKGG